MGGVGKGEGVEKGGGEGKEWDREYINSAAYDRCICMYILHPLGKDRSVHVDQCSTLPTYHTPALCVDLLSIAKCL